jgi:polysaccharide export outer membrane protein
VLDINVFQVADLTKTVQVDTGGKILLPLVGQMTAAAARRARLSTDLASALSKTYMRDPQVVVSVKEASSQKITVDGAVASRASMRCRPTTLMQAVALARGIDRSWPIPEGRRDPDREFEAGDRLLQPLRHPRRQGPGSADHGQDVIIIDTSGGKSFLANMGSAMPIIGLLPLL